MTEEEYNRMNLEVLTKYHTGKRLTTEEQYFLCDCRPTSRLLMLRMCTDEFYVRSYLAYSGPPYLEHLDRRFLDYFKILTTDWFKVIEKSNHKEPLMYWSAAETRRQIKAHRSVAKIVDNGFDLRTHFQEQFDTIAWFRYQYITLKRIWLLELNGRAFRMELNGQEILYDEFSMVHTVTRHFAEGMKNYHSGKDHFFQGFLPQTLHLQLDQILFAINASNCYASQSIGEINFRFESIIYRVYCRQLPDKKNGNPSRNIWRINTFFPIGDERMLKTLREDFGEVFITIQLSVFVKA